MRRKSLSNVPFVTLDFLKIMNWICLDSWRGKTFNCNKCNAKFHQKDELNLQFIKQFMKWKSLSNVLIVIIMDLQKKNWIKWTEFFGPWKKNVRSGFIKCSKHCISWMFMTWLILLKAEKPHFCKYYISTVVTENSIWRDMKLLKLLKIVFKIYLYKN